MNKDRHSTIEVNCGVCGNLFTARTERVEKGLGKFCSKKCFHENQIEKRKPFWGRKDLATKYKIGGRYCARWYDENGKTRSTSYSRWWWEMNNGDVPSGMIVLYKDNNPMNTSPSNFILGTKKDSTDKGKETLRKDPVKWEQKWKRFADSVRGKKMSIDARGKMSKAKIGKELSISHRNSLSNSLVRSWKNGVYDLIHKGENHKNWKPEKTRHPKEFNEALKDFIRNRDNHICQICTKDLLNKPKAGPIHHIDGIKVHNHPDNLILLCQSCHSKVHFSIGNTDPIIMAFHERLLA